MVMGGTMWASFGSLGRRCGSAGLRTLSIFLEGEFSLLVVVLVFSSASVFTTLN